MKLPLRISKSWLNVLAVLLNVIIVLLGLTLYAFNISTEGLLKEIGSGMVASGLAALILVLYQIASSAAEQQDHNIVEVAKEVGLSAYYPHRPDFGFDVGDASFNGAKKIQILEITGHTIFGKIQRDEWGRRCHEATIQVLLQDPLHPPGPWTFVNNRDYEEGNAIGTDLGQVRSFIRKFGVKKQFSGGGGSWELRLTRAMPTICYFRIDDRIYWAPYLAQLFGNHSPHMRVDRGGRLFEVLKRHFDTLWEAEVEREVLIGDDLDDLTAQWRQEIERYELRSGRPLPVPSDSQLQD